MGMGCKSPIPFFILKLKIMKTEELRRQIFDNYLREWTWTIPETTWVWNEDGSVDVDGTARIKLEHGMTKLPFKFRKVTGDFDFCGNSNVTSLEGSPDIVEGYFSCSRCGLNTLEYAPKKVGLSFYCYGNPGNFTTEDVLKVCKDVGGDIRIVGML